MALKIPSWVNVDFAQRILRLAEVDSTIQVIDVFGKPAISKGDNYGCDIIRVTVELTRKEGNKNVNEKKQLIFKFEPLENGIRQNVIRKAESFDTEIPMMTHTLEKMCTMLGCRLGPRVYYIRMEHPLCVIMEDLAIHGFRMADRTVGLDLAHCMLTIRGLAKFHASSVALCEKEPKHKSIYYKGLYSEISSDEERQFMVGVVQGLASEVENWPELGKRYADKIRNITPIIYQKGIEASKRKDDEFNVINHGDCWVNNIMFRYDENSKPIEYIFVDFQNCIYTSPAVDLHYFMATSSNEEVRLNNIDDLYEEYLLTLTTTMKQLGCKTQPPTMVELKISLKEREIYEMVSAMTILPLVTLDNSEVRDFDDMISNEGENPSLKNPVFRRIMVKKLQQYEKLGLLGQ